MKYISYYHNPSSDSHHFDLEFKHINGNWKDEYELRKHILKRFKSFPFIDVGVFTVDGKVMIRISFFTNCRVEEGFGMSVTFLKDNKEHIFHFYEGGSGIHMKFNITHTDSVF